MSSVILASSISSSLVNAAPFALEARSLGMGNVSVATADIATAALSNPAMLSFQQSKEDFSLLISGGVLIDDSDGMIDAVDAFQASVTQLDANQAVAATTVAEANAQVDDVNNMSNAGNALNNKALTPSATFAAVVGFSFQEYSLAFSARNDVIVAGGLTNANFGTGAIAPLPITANLTDISNKEAEVLALEGVIDNPANNIFVLTGVSLIEVGMSGAKSFTAFNQKMSIGITPKIISAETYTTSKHLSQFDTGAGDLIDTDNTVSLGEVTTIDVGFVSQISASTQIGLVIKNLIEDELVNGTDVVNISRQMKIGVAYRGDLFTIGADFDLIEIDPVITNTATIFQSKATQMASVGLEINAWDFAQVRLGMQSNMADNVSSSSEDALFTAGLGFWVGVNVDVAVIANDNTIGGFVQTGFKF